MRLLTAARCRATLLGAVTVAGLGLSACGSSPAALPKEVVAVLAAENEYGNVAAQVGGRYVRVTSVEDNPNVDPHNYEASPSVAAEVSTAGVVLQNGVGYDSWVGTSSEAASPSPTRKDVVAQALLGWPDSTPTRTCGTTRGPCRSSPAPSQRTSPRCSRRTPRTSTPTRGGSTARSPAGSPRSTPSSSATQERRRPPPSPSRTTSSRRWASTT